MAKRKPPKIVKLRSTFMKGTGVVASSPKLAKITKKSLKSRAKKELY
jgi:hypothetical protein